jgi:glycosyltransferase involved in cell wall biosynthesis
LVFVDLLPYLFHRFVGMVRSLRYLFRQYDAAIVGLHGLSPAFCCRRVRARVRFQIIRNDLSRCDTTGKADRNIREFHDEMDGYLCVAGTVRDSLVEKYPFLEAKVLGKPVIATHFSGVEEQITDGVNGLIVENNEDAIFEGMKRILTDDEFRASLANDNLPQEIMDDDAKVETLRTLIQGQGECPHEPT